MSESFERIPGGEEELYTAEDVTHWQERAADYKDFYNQLTQSEIEEVIGRKDPDAIVYDDHNVLRELQAVFLGEKPSTTNEVGKTYSSSLQATLAQYALEATGSYILDRTQCEKLLQHHHDFFEKRGITTVDEAFDKQPSDPALVGMMLGYPRQAVEDFETLIIVPDTMRSLIDLPDIKDEDRIILEHTFEMGKIVDESGDIPEAMVHEDEIITIVQRYAPRLMSDSAVQELCQKIPLYMNAKAVDVYGICWNEFQSSPESVRIQGRLKTAFEQSGILEE